MNTKRSTKQRAGVAAAVVSTLGITAGDSAEAGDRTVQHLAAQFAPVGLTGGETLRVNAVLANVPEDQQPEAPCPVILRLLNAAGNEVANDEVRLDPGQAAHVDYSVDSTQRAPLRPQVVFPRRCTGILSSMEVYDTETGKLHAIAVPSGEPERVDIEATDHE